MSIDRVQTAFQQLGLTRYQARVLSFCYAMGTVKVTELSRASSVPKAKIYKTLEDLCDMRLIKKIGNKPAEFSPVGPLEGLENLRRVRLHHTESTIAKINILQKEGIKDLEDLYNRGKIVEPKSNFLEIISVGIPSETETKKLYQYAKKKIYIFTRAFEYMPKVQEILAKKNKIVKVIFLNPSFLSKQDKEIQQSAISKLKSLKINYKFSILRLPLRGSVIDPDKDYKSGKCLFLVEEETIPVFMRNAILSENPSLAYGLGQYFELLWATLNN